MSGIAAIFHRDGRPVARKDIERVASALTMYGPEWQTVELMGNVAFAYTHFSNTPEAKGARQPVTGAGGRHIMVFNGRLDNRAELAEQLGLDTVDLRSMSDADLAMRCWERWETASLNKWLGEFALINWDKAKSRMIAACHQFGRRSLQYHEKGQRLIIASAPKGIHALGDVPREIDELKIAGALCQFYPDSDRTFFKDVKYVGAAHLLLADSAGVESRRYYSLKEHIIPVKYTNDDDYAEAGLEHLERSVSAMLRSSGPVGSYMSGGLDSSSVAVVAAKMPSRQGSRLPTFTWVPEEGWDERTESHCYGDETPYVRAIASRHPEIELNLVDAAGYSHYHRQDEFLDALEQPVRNALNCNWSHAILEQAGKRNITTMLEGHWGNPTLSYTGRDLFTHLWSNHDYRQLAKEIAHDAPRPRAFMKKSWAVLVDRLGPEWLWKLKETVRGRAHEASDDRWLRFSAIQPDFGRAMQIPERAAASAFNYFGKPEESVRDTWCTTIDRQSAAGYGDYLQGVNALFGIEVRDPFADRRLMEWSLGVPDDQFRRNGVQRWLIKRIMQGVLPDAVLHKPRNVGRQNSDWHLRLTRELPRMRADLEEMAADPDLARMIDIPRLQGLLNDWPDHTIVDSDDDRRFFLPVNLPLALQVGRFIQRVKADNLQP